MIFSPSRPPSDRAGRVGHVRASARASRIPATWFAGTALLALLMGVVAPDSRAQTDSSAASDSQTVAASPPAAAIEPPPRAPTPSPKPVVHEEPVAPPVEAIAPEPPADLSDLGAWLEYKHRAHLAALPDESRLFYRRGLIAARAGQDQDAIRLVRGAAELDPQFVTPHLTLASWFLVRDPSQALFRYAVVLDLVRRSFPLQIELIANLVFFTMYGLFVGLLATAIVIVFLRHEELRHLWEERLRRALSPASARVWAWALLIVPFLAGIGLALPVVFLLGLLWPLLRPRERVVHVALLLTLLVAPFSGHIVGRLAAPLREDHAPFYGTASLQDEAWSPERQATLQQLANAHPDVPFIQFGLGWSARQGKDLATAETAYRRALVLWPTSATVLNNLGNVMIAQGRTGAAIELYRRAIAADPACAAAHFNLSQVYTRQFEYRAASEAAAKASALDFELVKAQQALGTEDGVQPLADQWIAPVTFWRSLLNPAAIAATQPELPFVWRNHIETAGLPFAGAVVILGLGSLMLGVRWQRAMPLRPCHNCARVVCRRCAQRRRELALCPSCAEQESRAESPEFARVLLARQRGRMERGRRMVRTTLAALLPGYGLLAFHRVHRATVLIVATALLVAPWVGIRAPFAFQTGPGIRDGSLSPVLILGAWVLVYAASLLGYFSQAAREASRTAALTAPVRSRPSQVTQSTAKAA
jgi:tetratricopeptide (TPR) repeat protein